MAMLHGYTLFFFFLLKNIDYGYSLEPPRRGGSNEYHNLCFEQKCKNINFYLKTFSFFVMEFSIYLNRRVFVMMSDVLIRVLRGSANGFL